MPELLPTTMKDIAKHFGVSIATVSRSLNGSDRVNAEKRRLICDYAHEHNFYPNDIAKSLRNSRRAPVKVIGVIVPEFAHYYFSTILNGIEAAAEIRKSRDIPVIYLTAYSDEKTVERAKLTEPSGFLVKGQGLLSKPFDENELHAAIEITLYRHQMEKEHDQIASAMLMKTSEAVIATNSTGQIRFINNLAEEITGWRKDDALGKSLQEVFLPLSEIKDESSLEDALVPGELPEIISRSGISFRIKGTVTPIKDYKHQINGMVVCFQLHNH